MRKNRSLSVLLTESTEPNDTYVYALFDGQDDEPRYIGLTRHPNRRLAQHLANARRGHDCPRCAWIRSVPRVRMKTLGPDSAREAAYGEQWMIRHYTTTVPCRLLNQTTGGEGYLPASRLPSARRKIADAATAQMRDPGQRALRREHALRMWSDRGAELRAKLAARGPEWRKHSAQAQRRRASVRDACPRCGLEIATQLTAAAIHDKACARMAAIWPYLHRTREDGASWVELAACSGLSRRFLARQWPRYAQGAEEAVRLGFADRIG